MNQSANVLVIDRRKLGLRIREAYFAHHPLDVPSEGADLVYCVQAASGPPDAAEFNTSVVDLNQPLEVLQAALSRTYRYQIRRAVEKDALRCVQVDRPTKNDVEVFAGFYDQFARAKRLRPANRRKLERFVRSGALRISSVYASTSDRPLVAHAYIVAGGRVRMYYSASQIDKRDSKAEGPLVGRANKLLHWDGIVHFRSLGCRCYDLGGISDDNSLKGIDNFKRQFGGAMLREFNHVRPASVFGRIALAMARIPRRVRSLTG